MTPKLPEEQEVPEALILIYCRNPNVEQSWQLDVLSESHQLGHFLANRSRLQIMENNKQKNNQKTHIRENIVQLVAIREGGIRLSHSFSESNVGCHCHRTGSRLFSIGRH